ncbi:hypothetical protein [uncultured phage MedDCM-OCT-S04-C348]|nr:hypothetical protein [uncultured phage MedDCM-OCT-S04-C348]
MATPQQYLVTPTTGIDQSMVELLAEVLEVDAHQVIETALHEWLEANFMRINSLHRNTQQIYTQLHPES